MFPTFISILDIQSWWEVPSIAHFCSLFRAAFNLLDFDIEDLEEALLADGTEESSWLQELIVRLLSGCLANNEISTFNYQMFLRRLFRKKCQEHDRFNPFNTDTDFQCLPLRTKVEILQALCDFRLDAEDVLEHLKNLEADSLRVEPLGYDDNDSAYWYFYGTRLYREDFTFKNNKKVKSLWQVICFTEDDWYQLAKKFRKSNSKVERQLYRTLSENFLPELSRLFQEKEILHRKRVLEWLPRRNSSRPDINRQQISEIVVRLEDESPIIKNFIKDNVEEDLIELEENDSIKTRKKHKLNSEKIRKKKDQADVASPPKRIETRRHGVEMAEKRKQRELRSLNRGKAKEKASSPNMPGIIPVGRQTNNSLASATGQIVIQSVSNPNRQKMKTSQVFRQSKEDLVTGMYKILEAVKNHDEAWPFAEAVEEEYAPNYYTVIRRPMDLQKMEEKLDHKKYTSFRMFRDDFQLIVDNCRLYNGSNNEYSRMVENLKQVFERATDRYLDQISSSDDEIAVEFQDTPKENRNNSISKRKKLDVIESETSTKRKPTSLAHTQDKPNSPESNECVASKLEVDKAKNQKVIKTKTQISKIVKNVKNAKTKRSKKTDSPSPIRSRSRSRSRTRTRTRSNSKHRSLKLNSRSPSWHSPSPENWKRSEKLSTSVDSSSRKSCESSDDDKTSKTKSKHKHWKGVLKDKKQTHESDKELPKPKESSKKDKHIKLTETIEKLRAKSEMCLSDDGVLRPKIKEDKHKKKNKSFEKIDKTVKKQIKNKSKESVKHNKSSKCEYDFDEEESNVKNNVFDTKKSFKKNVKKTAIKNVPNMDDLQLTTGEVLKDFETWLDEAPKSPEYSSTSNSPSVLTGTEDTESVNVRNDQDSRKAIKIDKPLNKLKDSPKDILKRRVPFKDPLKFNRRREFQRTIIDRLQPGKSKGNLLSNIQNINKPEELFPLGPLSKNRELKNSSAVKDEDSVPKLSLGTVLDGFGQLHNFASESEKVKEEDEIKDKSNSSLILDATMETKKEEDTNKKEETIDNKTPVDKKEVKNEKATPNFNAWFKAFGSPKIQATTKKKPEPEEEKKEIVESVIQEAPKQVNPVVEMKPASEEPRKVISPEPESPAGQPIARQRRGSTGSSMSERSSFSQDMDSSPRMSIDERVGGSYPAPYPSPLHRSPASASPVMASPRQEDTQRPYPTLNGSIRVGFYQDTVSTKSSPDKSCSPRDQPHSPYPHYSEHVYTPAHTVQSGAFYTNPSYFAQTTPPTYVNSTTTTNPSPAYYDTTKPLTDQYNAQVPTPCNYPPEENINSPEVEYKNPATPQSLESQPYRQQVRPVEKQTAMFPVKKRLYSENEMINREEQEVTTLESQDINRDGGNNYGTNRSLEMGIVAGRQMDINSPLQQPPPPMQMDNRVESPTYARNPQVTHPPPQHPQMEIPPSQEVNMQQINIPGTMRPMNYPTTSTNMYNIQNHDSSYAINRPDMEEQRKLDMAKLSNMGYLNPNANMDMSRNSQYYSNRPASHPEEMRYPDSRVMSMGYIPRTEASMQNSDPNMTIPRPSFNSPSPLGMDQALGLRGNLANLSHIVDRYPTDERLLTGLQTSTPYSPHMFAKGIPTSNTVTMFNQPNIGMPYTREQPSYTRTLTELQSPAGAILAGKNAPAPPQQQLQQVQQQPMQQDKRTTRKRKTKQQPVQQQQPHPQINVSASGMPNDTAQQQGFQSYAGLKSSGEPSAISLKTTSVVPGSAFNFGPAPTGLGLSTGLYGENSSFLDEYRAPSNYYMAAAAAAHRATPDPGVGHPQSRPAGYSSLAPPFMGAHPPQPPLMDPSSPLYQQYLHQALLAPAAAAGAYPPPGYHAALSMRQPYDSMTRPPWL